MPKYIVVVMDFVYNDAIVLNCSELEWHKVQSQPIFIRYLRRQATPRLLLITQNTLFVGINRRCTQSRMNFLVVHIGDIYRQPGFKLR
ncbi:hypothetical protein D3C77_448720 [compost metagenome]